MKIIAFTILFLYSFVFNLPYNSNFEGDKKYIQDQNRDSSVTISISVVGDLMCHSPQFEYARVDKDSFDFNPPFREVKDFLSASDFTFANLETVTAGKESGGYTGYPRFNTPVNYLSALANAGFDLLVTANNHSLDRGETGILKTLEGITQNKINYVGTFKSQMDRDSIRIFDVKGINISVLAYSYGTNGNPVPKGKSYLINLIDLNLIKKDIQAARAKGAELVIVNYHFGEEYRREPVLFQKEVVDSTISFGADLIIGGHPHVLQTVKFYKTKNGILDSGFVAYSMGNFFSNQRKRYTDAGMILTIKVKKDFISSKISVDEVNFLPTWVYKGYISGKREYLILPANTDSLDNSFLSNIDIVKMDQAYSDTREIVTKYSNSVRLKELK